MDVNGVASEEVQGEGPSEVYKPTLSPTLCISFSPSPATAATFYTRHHASR